MRADPAIMNDKEPSTKHYKKKKTKDKFSPRRSMEFTTNKPSISGSKIVNTDFFICLLLENNNKPFRHPNLLPSRAHIENCCFKFALQEGGTRDLILTRRVDILDKTTIAERWRIAHDWVLGHNKTVYHQFFC